MDGETITPPNAAAVDLTGGSPAAAPSLPPNEARERLAITLGSLARRVTDLQNQVGIQKDRIAIFTSRVELLEQEAKQAREWIEKYKPLIEKFVNGPGRVLLKV